LRLQQQQQSYDRVVPVRHTGPASDLTPAAVGILGFDNAIDEPSIDAPPLPEKTHRSVKN
jgi:hypothetical protein